MLRYERQLEVKQAQVEEALRRIGHLDGFALEPIVAAEQQWRYRNKLEYSFGARRRRRRSSAASTRPARGSGSSHIEDCLLASEAGNEVRREVLAFCRERGLAPFDRRTHEGFLRNLVVREGRRTGQLQVRLVTGPGELDGDGPGRRGQLRRAALDAHRAALGDDRRRAPPSCSPGACLLAERLGDLELALSPEAFFQTNTEMAERLYGLVVAAAGAARLGARLRPLLRRRLDRADAGAPRRRGRRPRARRAGGRRRDAQRDAQRDHQRHASTPATCGWRCGELVERDGRPDVIVVDPPRAGLSQKIVRRIIEAAPRRIVYVSCNPTTLAPNAAQLVEAGWRLERVTPVDMFPQTPHIECVAVLAR